MSTSPETVLSAEPEVSRKEPYPGKLNRLGAWFKSLVQKATGEGRRQRESTEEQDRLTDEILAINIEQLCELSPEEFLQSRQFLQLLVLYNLMNHADDMQEAVNSSISEFLIGKIFIAFLKLRTDIKPNSQKERMFSEFMERVLKYLRDKTKETEVRDEVVPRDDDALVGVPDIIRRFDVIGIRLSYNDAYKDWCVFPRPSATASVVSPAYGKRLNSLTRKEMSLIEGAIRFNIYSRDYLMLALMNGTPAFDVLMEYIRKNLQKQ